MSERDPKLAALHEQQALKKEHDVSPFYSPFERKRLTILESVQAARQQTLKAHAPPSVTA
jgi:hypothetical protein